MATPPEQPWSDHEKNYLLAEIIKAAKPHPADLLNIIRHHNIQPRWEDIPLPPGRSLNSSRAAFQDLQQRFPSTHPMAAPMVPLTPTPLTAQAATSTIKRPFPFEATYSAPASGAGGREIRPKPITSGPSLYSRPSPTEPPPKRKRGRPTKVEALAKAEAAAAAAGALEVGAGSAPRSLPPPIQTPSSTTSSAPTLTAPVIEEPKPPLAPPATRMPIAAMLTPTAREPSASQSSSSSGKRRRARSTKTEPEETPVTRPGQRYESPYSRMGPGSEDSPARTAVRRHHGEDPSSASRTAPSERPAEGTEDSDPH